MSYDVWFKIQSPTVPDMSLDAGTFACTTNRAPIWRAAGINIHEWDGKKASEIVSELVVGIAMIATDLPTFRALEQWGSVEGTVNDFLRPMLKTAQAWPDSIVRVWR